MSSIILEGRDLRYRYPRGVEAIRGISFHIHRGEKIALVGPNGAGKSTLMLMFNGMIRPDSGTILFDDRPLRYDRASLRRLRQRVGFVLQNPDRQIIAPTVYQDVAFGPANLGYDEEAIREAVSMALRQVGLEGFERRPPHQLSGGEKRRVAIAGVLAMDPEVLVLDEPTSSLDPSGAEEIIELLDELNQDGKTVIISTHDVELAYPWADRVILMSEGMILHEERPAVAFANPALIRRAHLSMPVLLEIATELKKRGFRLPDRMPRSVLELVQQIESATGMRGGYASGTITVCNIDEDHVDAIPEWIEAHDPLAIGAMGTRAKQLAAGIGLELDFTYGVIDRCILRAIRGRDSLILTTAAMADRVFRRVEAYCRESGMTVEVRPFDGDT